MEEITGPIFRASDVPDQAHRCDSSRLPAALFYSWVKQYNPPESEVEMLSTHVSELTVEELKALVRETVQETLAEFLADPDRGLELRESMKAAIRRSNKKISEDSTLYSIHGAGSGNEKMPAKGNKITFSATVKEGMIKLPDEYIDRIGQHVQVIGILKRRERATQTLIDRLLTNPIHSKKFRTMSRNEIYER
jgi:hypothetical protein